MTAPSYVHAGTIAVANSLQTTLSVPYPSSTTAGNLILLSVVYVVAAGSAPSFAIPPTGFTTLSSGSANFVYKYLFYKNGGATGSEGGTSLTLNNGGGIGGGGSAWAAQFTEWAGLDGTGSSFYEGLNLTEGASSTVAGHSITTTGTDRLGVHFALGALGGATGVNVPASWTGVLDEGNATSGSSGTSVIHLDTIAAPTATTIAAPSSSTNAGSLFYASFDFALVPGAAPSTLVLLGQAWL